MFERLKSVIHFLRPNAPPLVAAIRLTGTIGPSGRVRSGLNMEDTAPTIAQAFRMPGLKAVALLVNSPGGTPVQAALIMRRIRGLAKEKDVPVLAFTEDVAASGGYMLALAGDEIYAHEASIVGSIGVVYGGFGFPEALAKLGVERRLYTAGEKKALLDPFSPARDEDIERLKDLQGEIHEYFKSLVRERRGKKLKGPRTEVFSGDVWLGAEAAKLGLIDGIGEVRATLRERFGERVRIKVIAARKPRLARLFGGLRGHRAAGAGWADELLAAIEARLWWSHYGL